MMILLKRVVADLRFLFQVLAFSRCIFSIFFVCHLLT